MELSTTKSDLASAKTRIKELEDEYHAEKDKGIEDQDEESLGRKSVTSR